MVTGASAGLGREFAMQLARKGYDLVLVARDGARLHTLANELKSFGASSEVIAADLTVDDDVSRVVARIDHAAPDVLVNNAGFGTRRSFVRESREQQEAMIRVHVLAANRLAHAAVHGMVARHSGAIINVSSIASWMTSPGNVNYSATKAWQRSFIESLSLELRASLAALERRRPVVVVPGIGYKVIALTLRFMPKWCWQLLLGTVRGSRKPGGPGQ